MEDADETHFIFKMANRKLLGSRGDMVVQYADIVSGGYSIKMMVRLTGVGGGMVQPPMLILMNANCTYPIRGVYEDVPGVS